MYSIESTEWGFLLTFGGLISDAEIALWLEEWTVAVDEHEGTFFVFVDMRTLVPMTREGMKIVEQGQRHARENGMLRSVVILNSPVTTSQFKRLAGESGILKNERYVDASSDPDWEASGMAWLFEGIESPSMSGSRKVITSNLGL